MRTKLGKLVIAVMAVLLVAQGNAAEIDCVWIFKAESNSFSCVSPLDEKVVYDKRLDEEVGVPKEHKDCDEKGMKRSLTNDNGLMRAGCVI